MWRMLAAQAMNFSLTRLSETQAPGADYERLTSPFSRSECVNLSVAMSTINNCNPLAVGFRKLPQA